MTCPPDARVSPHTYSALTTCPRCRNPVGAGAKRETGLVTSQQVASHKSVSRKSTSRKSVSRKSVSRRQRRARTRVRVRVRAKSRSETRGRTGAVETLPQERDVRLAPGRQRHQRSVRAVHPDEEIVRNGAHRIPKRRSRQL